MPYKNGNSVSVLNLDTRSEIARISVPGQPEDAATDKIGNSYTVSPDSKVVCKFDAESGKVIEAVSLDDGPIGIALAKDSDKLFVSDWYKARIWIIDTKTLEVLTELQTGGSSVGLAVSPDATLIVSADRDADQVSILDLDGLKLRHRLEVCTRSFGLEFAPDGRLFVGNVGSNDVTVLDPAACELLATLPVGARSYIIAFTSGCTFVSNQNADTVSVIDFDTHETLATIDMGGYPEGIDITGDRRTVFVANWFSNMVNLIDAETLEVSGEIGIGNSPRDFGKLTMQRN